MSADGTSEIVPSSREVIEHKLLASLCGGPTVAIVLTATELDDLIEATQHGGRYLTPTQASLVEDMRKLLASAFPDYRS